MTLPEQNDSLTTSYQDAPDEHAFSALSHLSAAQLDELAEKLTPRISAILARQVNQRRYGA